jgi:hypothetical protein
MSDAARDSPAWSTRTSAAGVADRLGLSALAYNPASSSSEGCREHGVAPETPCGLAATDSFPTAKPVTTRSAPESSTNTS